MSDKVKQIIIIRTDLKNSQGHKVRTGKLIAQACHASIAFLTNKIRKQMIKSESIFPDMESNVAFESRLSEAEKEWINGSFFKVCVGVDSEKELLDILEKARSMDVEVNLITDQGHTEFNGVPTNTCLALGPDYSSKLDVISGHLKLI